MSSIVARFSDTNIGFIYIMYIWLLLLKGGEKQFNNGHKKEGLNLFTCKMLHVFPILGNHNKPYLRPYVKLLILSKEMVMVVFLIAIPKNG